MRILFFNYEYPPIGGGGANANAYLFREFAKRPSLKIDCVTSAWGRRDEVIRFAENITLYRLAVGKKQLHFWTQRETLHWLWKAYRKGAELLRTREYDLCHAFFGFPSGMMPWMNRNRLPYLISLRGSDVPGFNPRLSFQYVLLGPLFRRIWRDARFVIANSQGLKNLALDFAPDGEIGVIPNGIDVDNFTPSPRKTRKPGQILCVSRLVGRKGIQHLIEAMRLVVADVPEARLTIVGEGDLEQRLKRQADELGLRDRVEFLGRVPHDELAILYRGAELFVQPSFYEGMSNTVLEAMASGLPIVATGEGGKEELFRGNASLAEFGNPSALAKALIGRLKDRKSSERMGVLSREIAETFSWESVAHAYEELYQRIGAEPRCPAPASMKSGTY